jgi:8-oxo-(d)GTP phosphatase
VLLMLRVIAVIVLLITLTTAARARAEEDASATLQALATGGYVILLRHATAPGTGDPVGFRLGDCSTQRTLSDAGREQARRIGDALKDADVRIDAVYSSQWCRCRETAELLGLGPVASLPLLNSFFRRPAAEGDVQTQQLRAWLVDQRPKGAIVLVTHQVNITALTGVFPQSGEMVVVRPPADDRPEVIGRLRAP